MRAVADSARPVTHYGWGVAEVEKVASNRRLMGDDGKVRAEARTVGNTLVGTVRGSVSLAPAADGQGAVSLAAAGADLSLAEGPSAPHPLADEPDDQQHE